MLQVGRKNRQTAATAMNKDSSRSHSVLTITVESSEADGSLAAGDGTRVGARAPGRPRARPCERHLASWRLGHYAARIANMQG